MGIPWLVRVVRFPTPEFKSVFGVPIDPPERMISFVAWAMNSSGYKEKPSLKR